MNALLLLLLTAVLWSFGGILIKSVSLHPLAIAGIRSGIAALVLVAYAGTPQFAWTRVQFAAAVCLALTVVLFVVATKLTTAANAILLQYTAPVYVAVLSGPLLKEKITGADATALFVTMLGMVLFFVEEVSPHYLAGNVVALLSGASFAGLVICLRLQKGRSTLESILLGHILTVLVGLPFVLGGPMPSARESLWLLLLGVVQLGIPYILYRIALRHVTALEAILVPVIEPVLNPVWVFLALGERPRPLAMCGGAVVVGTVLVHSLLKRPRH